MLEFFEAIYNQNKGATDQEIEELYEWLKQNRFPSIFLPDDYLHMMKESNGGGYLNGEREYQFLSLKEVKEFYEAFDFSRFMPYAFPFAMDGNGNFYILNLRTEDEAVYWTSAGNLGWEKDAVFVLANNLRECFAQKTRLEETTILDNEQRAEILLQKYGFDFSSIPKDEIRELIEREINDFQEGSSEYIRLLCGYLFCIGDVTDVPLLEKAKYGINMDVGCMIDGEWIDILKNAKEERESLDAREDAVKAFIAYYADFEE